MDLVLALMGLIGGFTGGLLGLGGGAIFIPLLMMIKGFDSHQAIGTSLLVIVFTAIFGAFFHHQAGMVNTRVGIILGIFSILGVWLGTKLSLKMDALVLQRIFAVFLALIAVKLFFFK